MSELKEYHFTDEQIDRILYRIRDYSVFIYHDDPQEYQELRELANQIEDQIVNHPTND